MFSHFAYTNLILLCFVNFIYFTRTLCELVRASVGNVFQWKENEKWKRIKMGKTVNYVKLSITKNLYS